MTEILIAHSYHPHLHSTPVGTVSLGYEDRFLRRKTVTLLDGQRLLIDLAAVTSLNHGGALRLSDGREVEVRAAPEALLSVTGVNLVRLAWHIGNRHTPCQIEDSRLLIQRDHVIHAMLDHLGATVSQVEEPFTPEGGAYGHGRTHAHEHGQTVHTHGIIGGDGHAH